MRHKVQRRRPEMLLTASIQFLLCNFSNLNDVASAFSTFPPHAPTALLPISLSYVGDDSFPPRRRHPRQITSELHDISYSASSNGGWGVSNRDQSSPDGGDHTDGSAEWDALLPRGFTFADEEDYDDDDLNNGAWPNNNDHAICAPEVNKWTTLMVDGTNAAIHRPGKEMTLEEGMEILYNDLKDLSDHDNTMIETYWDRLMPTVSYLGTANAAKVKQALRVAYRAHRSQMRKSGEPFIIHPVEVALLLSGMKMDAETVMAGLLHDTVEDTELTFEQVEAMFGEEVKNIVEGETKVSKLPKLAFADYADEQAENLRQMFIAMTDDYRIIIVKLADRLHNMRTLRHMKPEKQKKISRETLDIFAPLAHRMGIWNFKSELEDIAFMYLYPEEYKLLKQRLHQRQSQFEDTLNESITVLNRTLKNDPTLRGQDVGIEVVGRTKELYSLWHKMEVKHDKNLDNISDLVALRVILTPGKTGGQDQGADSGVWLCYHVLGLVQHLPGFQPMPTKVKDYISFPKPNGYQSLHTALIYKGQSVEVQIRTSYMHQVAEYGMASHWSYKDEKKRPSSMGLYNTPWLSSIKEWQQDMVCSRDFVDCVRRELLGKRVFVFLRNGKILNLARGATAVDAAFQIHTEVGLSMHGVEINGKPVPISYELKNGDVVSILTGGGKPTTEWMRFAKSRSTRSKLRAYFRSKQNESFRKSGEMLFFDYLHNHQDEILQSSYLEFSFEIPTTPEQLAQFLPGRSRYTDVDELLTDIGKTHDSDFLRQKASKIFLVPFSILLATDESQFANITRTVYAAQADMNNVSLSMKNLSYGDVLKGGEVEFADVECICPLCLPVRGDTIVGTRKRSVDAQTIVHRSECSYAQEVLKNAKYHQKNNGVYGYNTGIDRSENGNGFAWTSERARARSRVISSQNIRPDNDEIPVQLIWPDLGESWISEEHAENFLTEIVIVANDRKLLLADCSVVASKNSEILKTGSSSSSEHCILEFLVRVRNLDELQYLMDKLREVDSVMSVERRFGSELFELI
mmetsp:Transcript_30603/g.63698  ORF Transcript_30603/g.63698 Transcript_30603/m.63698 type:complete len:1027 (-) Transcript_30603:179-3259(-)